MGTLVVGLAVCPVPGHAQNSPGSMPPGSPSLAANPLLVEVAKATPDTLPIVFRKLESLTTGARAGGSRGDADPTAKEAAQISRNPVFRDAFAHNPGDTLRLLRWTNAQLRGHDGQAR